MSPAEIVERGRHELRIRADVVGRSAVGQVTPASRVTVPSHRPALLLSRSHAELVSRFCPEGAQRTVSQARRFACGDFELLGYPSVRLSRPIDYSHDPFTGESWPEQHGLRINYRRVSVGDPKWIWELNRLQHVPLVLAAWLLEGDE